MGFAPVDADAARTTLAGTSAASITNLVALGDVSGDGVADLFFTTQQGGLVELHRVDGPVPAGLGAWEPLATTAALTTVGADTAVVASLGDLTGDGRADLAVAVGTYDGELVVFAGGDLAAPPHARLTLPAGSHEPTMPSRLHDLTGDGRPDLVIGNRYREPLARGAVDVLPGPLPAGARTAAQYDAEPATIRLRTAVDSQLLGAGLGVTDVDGDGDADLVVGADQSATGGVDAGETLVLTGPLAGGTVMTADVARTRILGAPGDQSGTRIVTGFDGDGDGDGDLVSIGWCGLGCAGVLTGVADVGLDRSYLPADASYRVDGDLGDDHFGLHAALVGDLDGDGVDDLAVGVARPAPQAGVVYLLRGGRTLPATGQANTVADQMIVGTGGFGQMVVGAD